MKSARAARFLRPSSCPRRHRKHRNARAQQFEKIASLQLKVMHRPS
jgi:hypothetical protein